MVAQGSGSQTHADLDMVLGFDALHTAEQITDKQYSDEETSALGFALMLRNNQVKEQLLTQSGDSHFNSTFEQQVELFYDLGFETVQQETFYGDAYGDAPKEETFMLLWHPDGILASVESYNGTRRNSAKMYYNWVKTDEAVSWFGPTESGHLMADKDVWVGNHDVREGLRHSLRALRSAGHFLPKWEERPFLWLLNYSQKNEAERDYQAVNAQRISRLPQHIQDAIGDEEK